MKLESYSLNFSQALQLQTRPFGETFLDEFKIPADAIMKSFASSYCTVKNDGDVTELAHEMCRAFFTTLSDTLMNNNNKNRIVTQNIVAGWAKMFMCNSYIRDSTLVTTLDVLSPKMFYSENFREHWLVSRARTELFLNTLH